MASMDNLRDKIRSKRGNTNDLHETSSSVAAQHIDEVVRPSQTDSLISEIFSEEADVEQRFEEAFQSEVPHSDYEHSRPTTAPDKKTSFTLPFIGERLKHLEVNRKMLLISLGVAALASFLSISYLKGIAEPLRGKSQMIKVVTLTQDVPPRTALTEDMLKIKEVPAAYLPEGALQYKPKMHLLGQVTTTSLYKGEVLHSKRISLPSEDMGITAITPDGFRPITISADNATLIKPSSAERKEYVDVVASLPDPNPARRGKLITIPVLQRSQVLAVGDRLSADDVHASASPSNRITLAVPAERVNLMVILKEKGNFNVIPRSPEDTSTQPERYTIQEIEDALQGKFDDEKVAEAPTPEPKEEKEEPDDPPAPQAPLVDLSTPARSTYRAPARRPVYRAPVARKPVYHAPVKPKAPKAAPVRKPVRAPLVINGGVITQGGGK